MSSTLWLNGHGSDMSFAHLTGMILSDLLKQMNACAVDLERIAGQEREAASRLEADALIRLSGERVTLYEKLADLENECRGIVHQADMPKGRDGSDDIPLSTFIDLHAGGAAGELQALRREACQHLIHASRAGEESLVHLHVMYEVTSGVLRNIGAMERKSTYGPGGAW